MSIVGARPNFMKIASIIDAIKTHNLSANQPINHILVHTGQHYDDSMSEAFFRDLELPKPDIYLGVGSASHAVQTAKIMKHFEPVLLEHQPDVVLLVGDVNSTVACALVTSKIQYNSPQHGSIKKRQHPKGLRPLIAHVEAGLRSFDRTMPEEINRLLTDAISDFLFTTEKSANENLRHEGIPKNKIFFVGNTMIDTLLKHKQMAQKSDILNKLGLSTKGQQPETSVQQLATRNQVIPYGILTLHRPSNVDYKKTFQNILEALLEISKNLPIIFPVHPRTLNRIKEFCFENYFEFSTNIQQPETSNFGIYCIDPLGYLDFLCLMSNAKLVLTDSGGMQEETTVLGIPCITMRENTERPVTVTQGTNIIVGTNKSLIVEESLKKIDTAKLPNNPITHSPKYPFLWDGKAGQRIVKILVEKIMNNGP